MIVPPKSMTQVCRRWGGDRFEDCDISLRRDVPAENNPKLTPIPRDTQEGEAAATEEPNAPCEGAPGPVPSGLRASPRPGRAQLASPKAQHSPSRFSPLDIASVSQEIIEDPEASGGLKVPEAHDDPRTRPRRRAKRPSTLRAVFI